MSRPSIPHVGRIDPRGGTGWDNMSNILSLLPETGHIKQWVISEFKNILTDAIVYKIIEELKPDVADCNESELCNMADYVNKVLQIDKFFDGYIIVVPQHFVGIIYVTFVDCSKWNKKCVKYYFDLNKLSQYAELLNITPRQLAIMRIVETKRCQCGLFHFCSIAVYSTDDSIEIESPHYISLERYIYQQIDKIPRQELVQILIKMLQE